MIQQPYTLFLLQLWAGLMYLHYWVALKELADQSGKTINIKIVSSPWAMNNSGMKAYLRKP